MPQNITISMTVTVDDHPPEEVRIAWSNNDRSRIPAPWPSLTKSMLFRVLQQTAAAHPILVRDRVTPGPPRPAAQPPVPAAWNACPVAPLPPSLVREEEVTIAGGSR